MNAWCRRTLRGQRMVDFVLMIIQVMMRLKQALNMKKKRFKMKEQYAQYLVRAYLFMCVENSFRFEYLCSYTHEVQIDAMNHRNQQLKTAIEAHSVCFFSREQGS